MARTPEGKMKDKITRVLKELGIWYFFPASNGMGRAGIPDIVSIYKGKFIGIEVKANNTKHPTALQQKCGDEIRQAGGWWFLVRSEEELATMIAVLKLVR